MHYYQFNIGDYVSHTRHLSPIEDIAYRRLLDAYYLSERPLNSGIAVVARQIGLKEYEAEVHEVLQEFFKLNEDGWINTRADKEIAHFKGKIEQASRAGKASAKRRLNSRSTDVQPTNNHKPITNNQIKKIAVQMPEGVSVEVWDSFVKHRKTKKAPITDLVMASIRKEAITAGWTVEQAIHEIVVRNWSTFKSDWVDKKVSGSQFLGGI